MTKNTPEDTKKAIVAGFEGSGLSVHEYCKKNKVSPFQFYSWRRQFEGKAAKKTARAKPQNWPVAVAAEEALRAQNAALKEMLRDAILENEQLKKAA